MTDGAAAARLGRGELYAAVAAVAFGSSYVATAFALRSFQPLPLAVHRSLLAAAAIGLLLLIRARRASHAPDRTGPTPRASARAARLLVLAIVGGFVFLAAINLAVAHVGATISAFVAGLYAVFAAVLAPLVLPERLSPRALLGFVLALAGTALLAELDPATVDVAGIAWGLLAALSFGLFLVLVRRWSRPYAFDGLEVAVVTFLGAGIGLGAVVLVTDASSLLPERIRADAAIAYVWLAATAAVGQALAAASIRLVPAARSAAFLLLNPITATILAALLLAERPSPVQLGGGSLVLLGIALATLRGTLPLRRGRLAGA